MTDNNICYIISAVDKEVGQVTDKRLINAERILEKVSAKSPQIGIFLAGYLAGIGDTLKIENEQEEK